MKQILTLWILEDKICIDNECIANDDHLTAAIPTKSRHLI